MPIDRHHLHTFLLVLLVVIGAAILGTLALRAEGGPLDPPGPVGSTMKSLDQVEPRTPISSVPFTISQSGSYYLTANVTLAAAANGITIAASDVVLDLNGYTIDGASVGGKGIYAQAGTKGVTIRNGTVTRFNGYAFDAQNGAVLENVHANFNQVGIVIRGTLRGCSVTNNTIAGVYANYSTVTDCFAEDSGTGFSLTKSSLRNCSSISSAVGIAATTSNVADCSVGFNSTGILVTGNSKQDGGSQIMHNTVYSSGAIGINVPGWNSAILENTVTDSGATQLGSGINITGQRNRVDSNHVNDSSAYGIIANGGTGNVVVRNWADANATDYFAGPGNNFGPVQQAATATSPWANLTQ